MKVLSMMKKAALGVCAIVLGACCWNIATAKEAPLQDNYIEAKAETTASLTVSNWGLYSNCQQLYEVKITFDGFTAYNKDTTLNPMDSANDFIYKYLKINGRTLKEINEGTNVSGWVWEHSSQQTTDFQKPVIVRPRATAFYLRIHKNFYDAMMAEYGKFVLTAAGDLTVSGYIVDQETSYQLNGSTWERLSLASATVSNWGLYSNCTQLYEMKITFDGFTAYNKDTTLNPMDSANDFIYKYLKINGRTLKEINEGTNVSGWVWEHSSQQTTDFQKPVIVRPRATAFYLRIHKNFYDAMMAEYGKFVITIADGLTVSGYMLDQETSYKLNGSTWEEYVEEEGPITSTLSIKHVSSASATIDYYYIYFDGFNTKMDYDEPVTDDYVFRNIYINGKSIHDINKNTDVSGWAWDVFPQTEQAVHRKPVISYIGTTASTNKYMEVRVHKNLKESLLANEEKFEFSVNAGFEVNGCVLGEDTTVLIEERKVATPITVDNFENYPHVSQLYYTYVNFEGFNTMTSYSGDANSDYVFKNILINGKSIYDINATTNVSGWTWEVFPQTTMASYQKPIIGYLDATDEDQNGTADLLGKLQLRIHKKFHEQIVAEYGALEITVKENLMLNGYINKTETTLVKNSAGQFVAPTVLDASAVSLSRWQPLADKQLTYFDIKYSAFPQLDYQVMDVAAYAYIMKMIEINGVKMSDINNNTNVDGWSWVQFPSTAAAVYQKPFLTLISAGSMEVRMHDNYWNTIKENGLKVSLLPGYYIENDGTMYVLSEKVTCVKDPDVNDYVAEGGFEQTVDNNVFEMWEGASVRMSADSTGIRFTAQVSKAYLDGLTASGASYKLMMQVNRENSDKTAYKECTNVYEEGDYVYYSVAIVNLKESSYALTYTAKPYVEITAANGDVSKVYTQQYLQSRTIKDVAYSAYTDVSETYDSEKYPYEMMWEGKVQYSPYTAEQRDILASFVTDVVLLSDGVYRFENESNGNFLMLSDNAEVNAFFNEYADRFIYYYKDFAATGEYVTDTVVGNASTSWKDWEAESILFIDSLHLNGNDEQFRNDIQGTNVDKYGYVWEGNSFFGQGWNSPTYIGSRAKTSDPFLSDGWEFVDGRKNSSILAIDSGATGTWGACDVDWTVSGNGTFASATVASGIPGSAEDGYFLAHAQGSTYVTYALEDTRSLYNGVLQAEHAPFVEIGLQWNVLSGNVNEVYLEFKSGNGAYVSLPLSQWATTEIDFSAKVSDLHLYVPVFEHADWTGKITGLRVRIEGNFTAYFYLDFVRGCYDLRMVDSNTSFISAGKQHFENTGDLAYLIENMPRYRKALMFLTGYMTDNGLINLSNLVGHDGSAQGFATSFISTYWDIVSLAPNSSYVNALYYKALMNMAYLEDALTANSVTAVKPTVKTTLAGADITYSYTAAQLREMAAVVRSAVSADLNESNQTGYFKTFTVIVNGESMQAGRFIEGYYGNTQIDFGAVALNLMILESGVATAEQEEKVLNWIASIDNLYEYTFAPKTNTEDLKNQYCWAYKAEEYGVSCQNGGAILFVSYYDILARAKVFGAENAYARLSEIMTWFADVEAAFVASGETDAKKFFEPYYNALGLTLQGRNEEGSLGLHAEFIENAILYALVPNAFFGMDTYYADNALVMQVAPNLPDAIDTWKMEQVRYAGLTYDIAIANNFVVVCNVEENASGALSRNTQLEVTLSYTGETPKVYVNNKLVREGYTVNTVDKTVTITVDFGDVNISVR